MHKKLYASLERKHISRTSTGYFPPEMFQASSLHGGAASLSITYTLSPQKP